jgi:hypothetical protein
VSKRNAKQEWLPWYRARGYKGNLSEARKRQLDAFRSQPKHPAATCADLPREAQMLISGLEIDLSDRKKENAFAWALLWTMLCGAWLLLDYYGCRSAVTWQYIAGGGTIALAWIAYYVEERKITEEFFPSGINSPQWADEALRREWELEYIINQQRLAEEEAD